MNFFDYDRISDQLLYLNKDLILSFVSILSSKDLNGNRKFFEYEAQYSSNYYGRDNNYSIKRRLRYYFVLEFVNEFGSGMLFKHEDIYPLIHLIESKILPWYDESNHLYQLIDNKLAIVGNFTPVQFVQDENRSIIFSPVVIDYDNQYGPGIEMRICGNSTIVELPKFFAFYSIIKNTDMYNAACNMINFAKIPPHGENIVSAPTGLGAPPQNSYNSHNSFLNKANKKGDK